MAAVRPQPHDHASRGLGPVMRARAVDVLDHPHDWVRWDGQLIWQNLTTGARVTDQAVDTVRREREPGAPVAHA